MHHYHWGIPVAMDLFLAALGAGAFMVAVMADLADTRKYKTVSAIGALIAPWPVIAGVLLLVVDLGQPLRFWEMMLRRGEGYALESPYIMFSSTSTMSIGTWVLTAFVYLSLAYIGVTLLAYPFKWAELLRKALGVCGLPVALAVTIYTGVLISATSNPVWNNWLLPVAFVTSAVVTGAASVAFVLAAMRIAGLVSEEGAQLPKLEKLTGGLIIAQLVAVAGFILVGLGSAAVLVVIASARFGPLFWIGIVGLGLIVPLVYNLKGPGKAPNSLVISCLVLLGGFFLRYVVLIAGQV